VSSAPLATRRRTLARGQAAARGAWRVEHTRASATLALRLKLVIEHDGARTAFDLGSGSLSVGRALDNDVHLPDSRVSRHHCRIDRAEGGVRVTDLGSANGLVVNGVRTREAFVAPGDELWIGSARLVVEEDLGAAEDEALRTQVGDGDAAALLARALAESARAVLQGGGGELVAIVDRALAAVGGERAFLYGLGASGLEPLVARRFDRTDLVAPHERAALALLQRVLDTGRAMLSLDAARDERLSASSSVLELGLRSLLVVPLPGARAPLGVLQIDHRLQAGAFDAAALELASAFAALASTALARRADRARLEAERSRVDELSARLEVVGATSAPTSASARDATRRVYPTIIGRSAAMREVFDRLDRIVECDLPVFVHGESGTGKELAARAIHAFGARSKGPFVSENCAALPDTLLESELFGHARGAFTGADRAKKGLLEQAHGGTLFLDEIGDMSPEMQKKLLRVLQEGELRPVGSSQRIQVDVRLVSASHRDLERMVGEGAFREDLYYRVNVLDLRLPSLRERPEDVPLLARALLERAAAEMQRRVPALSAGALERLCAHAWPGNVRELENEMRRMVVLGKEIVAADDLSRSIVPAVATNAPAPSPEGFRGDLPTAVARFERRAIEAALQRHEGNKSRAAAELGLSRFALQRKLDKYAEDDAGGVAGAAPGPE
jgi:transcriptional regulator with GAF, ATPase, and Fis domain